MPPRTPLDSLSRGSVIEALEQCLSLWTTEPSAELADVIVAIGAHVAKNLVVSKTNWDEHARARDALWLTPLLETLVDEGSVKARSRLTLLVKWPADPRIDRWAAELLAKPPFTSTGARPLFTQIAERAKTMSDPTAIERLRLATAKRTASDPFKAIGAKVLAAVDAKPTPSVPPTQRALCRDLMKALKNAPEVSASSATSTKPRGTGPDALLAQWRETFDPKLVAQLDDAESTEPELELPAQLKARIAALVAASEDVGQRTRVAEATVALARNAGVDKTRPILQAWLALEMDPRFGRATVALLSANSGPSWTGVSKDLVKCLFHHADTATAKTLDPKVVEEFIYGPVATKKWKTLLETRAGTHDAPAAVAPSRSKVSGKSEASFIAAIVENPSDDGPRAVYADWLLEQGDRRGEFIQLQLARAKGKVSAEAKEREKKLFADLRAALLGPLNECFAKSGLEFKRGFLVKGTPYRLVDDPRLALLERLELEHIGDGELGTTTLSSLVSAKKVPPRLVSELLALAPNLESLSLTHLGYGEWRAKLSAVPRAVKHLAVGERLYLDQPVALVNELLAMPLTREVETLTVGPLREAFDPAALTPVPATLAELVLETKAGRVVFHRDGGRFVQA